MEKPNFWDQTHSLSADSERLYEQLVPGMGNCTSLQGELLRASSKIGYDWYNNGWGCNNWSGAVIFLQRYFHLLPKQPSEEILSDLRTSLSWVYEYSHGEPAPRNDETANMHVTRIHEIVVQAILDNPESVINSRDMHDFAERDYDDRRAYGRW